MSDPVRDIARAGSVAAVVNPVKGEVSRVRQSIAREAHDGGLGSPLWFETSREDQGADAARRAVEAGVSLVVTSGGDGTIRAVAGALRHTGVALGIVPSGTGNLLARNLGIPINDPDAAVRIAFEGHDRVVDVGVAELTPPEGEGSRHPFTIFAGVGVDAAMIANTSPALKERVGWLAYVDGVLRSVVASKPVGAKVAIESTDGAVETRGFDVHSVLVGNIGGLPGGLSLIPTARIDDGVLDVAIMHPRGVFGWFRVGRAIVWENQLVRRTELGKKITTFRSNSTRNVLEYGRGPVVTVRLDPPIRAELDGDEFGLVRKAVFRVDAGSLIVRVPAA